MRWDNITILQAVDRHQEQFGGGEVWGVDGRQLMDEVAGSQVTEDGLVRGFLQELEILERERYLTFTVDDHSPNHRTAYPYLYLQQIRGFALTVKGQDRARGIRVVQPLPNPDEDDDRPIPALVLQQIAYAIAEEYTPQQILIFLDEAGVLLDRLPFPEQTPDVRGDPGNFVCGVLIGLDQWGSEGRRILRGFIGSWLDDRFISGPTEELRADLIEKLARRGWYVVDGNLVIGDPAKGKRVRSPILRDARLAALHPEILAVSEQLFRDEHRVGCRLRGGQGGPQPGQEDDRPTRRRCGADGQRLQGRSAGACTRRSDHADREGHSSRLPIPVHGVTASDPQPSAHEQFGEMDDDEALELLGLASHLMRKLDEASQT